MFRLGPPDTGGIEILRFINCYGIECVRLLAHNGEGEWE